MMESEWFKSRSRTSRTVTADRACVRAPRGRSRAILGAWQERKSPRESDGTPKENEKKIFRGGGGGKGAVVEKL